MSDDRRKRRCIVKRLDFEDCVVTNIKSKTRGQKKLRAKTCRQIEETFSKSEPGKKSKFQGKEAQFERGSGDLFRPSSPILSQRCSIPRLTQKPSPILTRKTVSKSPDLSMKRKRKSGSEKPTTEASTSKLKPETPPKMATRVPIIGLVPSPVLDQKRKSKTVKKKEVRKLEILETPEKAVEDNLDMMIESATLSCNTQSSSDFNIIEDSSDPIPSSKDSKMTVSETSEPTTPKLVPIRVHDDDAGKGFESGKKKKRYKPNSMSGRLQRLLRIQLSDRRIWDHERKVLKSKSNLDKTFVLISSWQNSTKQFLKCQQLNSTDNFGLTSTVLIVVDRSFVPEAKDGALVRISPPWQKLSLPGRELDVLLSVIYIEIDKTILTPVKCTNRYEQLPISQYENADSSFIDSLFMLF